MKIIHGAVFASALFGAGAAMAQSGMLVDYAADQMVTKFQTSSCEELKADKEKPKTDEQKAKAQSAKEFLQNDAQARTAFVNKVAAPVLNKMFECGMLP
jgi:hydroxymethylglutaryl-CoA reductase